MHDRLGSAAICQYRITAKKGRPVCGDTEGCLLSTLKPPVEYCVFTECTVFTERTVPWQLSHVDEKFSAYCEYCFDFGVRCFFFFGYEEMDRDYDTYICMVVRQIKCVHATRSIAGVASSCISS